MMRLPTRARALASLLIVAWLAVAACGGGDGDGDDASPQVLLFGIGTGAIVEFAPEGATVADLHIDPNAPHTYLRDPAVSPDGTRVAFVYAPPRGARDGRSDVSTDIWMMNRDGSGAAELYVHTAANETHWNLRWQDDDSLLAVRRLAPDASTVLGGQYALVRVTVDGGAIEVIAPDVTSFDLSPDGEEFAVVRVRPLAVGFEETIAVVGIDGGERRVLVPADQPLGFFGSVRWSPEGDRIAFFGLEREVVFRPKPVGQDAPAGLYLIDAEGGEVALVTEFDASEGSPPGIAWQPGADRVYVAGRAGVYDVDLDEKFAERLSETQATGQIDIADAR
jgi:Tol biopolymer transport system component